MKFIALLVVSVASFALLPTIQAQRNVTTGSATVINVTFTNYFPANCLEIKLKNPGYVSGVYLIHPRPWFDEDAFPVYCDMDTDGGGWIVIQRRGALTQNRENFDRGWSDYKRGFGDLTQDFWIGLGHIYILTVQEDVSLRVDLQDFQGNMAHEIYRTFKIKDRNNNYAIYVSDEKSGPANDPFWINTEFSTKDRSSIGRNCSSAYAGGWWLKDQCPIGGKMHNLNGQYYNVENGVASDGIYWPTWRADKNLKTTEMKIRPSFFPKCDNGGSHFYYD